MLNEPKTYIFGQKPWFYTSNLEKCDNPEIDTSDYLDESGIKKYQSLSETNRRWYITH